MNLCKITDPSDPRLALYLDLKDRDIRRGTGQFLAEGEHVVRRAFEAGLTVRSVLVAESKADRVVAMAEAAGRPDVDIFTCPKTIMQRATGIQLHQGVIAAVDPPDPVTLEAGLSAWGDADAGVAGRSPVVVVCPEITNVDNLGLLVRVSAGLGVSAMVLGPRCADPWYRRAVRVSMGAVFTLPIVRSGDLASDLELMRSGFGLEMVATVIDADAPPLAEFKLTPASRGRCAVLLGSEGYGLSPQDVARCDRRVRIPMYHDVDSLNVAVAAGIVLHHLVSGNAVAGG